MESNRSRSACQPLITATLNRLTCSVWTIKRCFIDWLAERDWGWTASSLSYCRYKRLGQSLVFNHNYKKRHVGRCKSLRVFVRSWIWGPNLNMTEASLSSVTAQELCEQGAGPGLSLIPYPILPSSLIIIKLYGFCGRKAPREKTFLGG